MAALGLPQTSSLDYSSTLPSSCSAFRPLHVKLGAPRRARIVCSSSGQSQQEPASSRKSALTKLVATGLAIVISSSSGVGVSQAAVTDIRQAQTQAENLLKDADKLTNDESPPRVGPQRGFVKDEDADRVALKGGAGAIPDLQNPGSEFVGKARGKLEERTETTKQRFGEQLGKVQSKASEARENVQGFFGQAGDKATDKAGEAKDNVQGVVGKEAARVSLVLLQVRRLGVAVVMARCCSMNLCRGNACMVSVQPRRVPCEAFALLAKARQVTSWLSLGMTGML